MRNLGAETHALSLRLFRLELQLQRELARTWTTDLVERSEASCPTTQIVVDCPRDLSKTGPPNKTIKVVRGRSKHRVIENVEIFRAEIQGCTFRNHESPADRQIRLVDGKTREVVAGKISILTVRR